MTEYQLIANSVSEHSVREETVDGDRHLVVEDVPFVRAMDLAGGYVPEAEIEASVAGWDGVPVTENHPRDEMGQVISANSPGALEEFGVGRAENPHHDGTWVRADIRVNADRAEAMGGDAADIVSAIESGEAFDVSSQYVPKPLPEGEYDGQFRSNVEGIARPDSIALLPHKTGRCSMADGCGINPQPAAEMAANVRVPMTRANGTHDGEDTDLDADAALGAVAKLRQYLASVSTSDEPAESGADPDADAVSANSSMENRDTLIDEIVSNSDVSRASLEDACDERVDLLHGDLVGNDAESDSTDPEPSTDDGAAAAVEQIADRLDAIESKMVTEDDLDATELAANAQREREQAELAQEIVANSAEYDSTDAVREDFPTTAALEAKRDSLDSAGMPGAGGFDGVTGNESTADEYDVGSGVLTE